MAAADRRRDYCCSQCPAWLPLSSSWRQGGGLSSAPLLLPGVGISKSREGWRRGLQLGLGHLLRVSQGGHQLLAGSFPSAEAAAETRTTCTSPGQLPTVRGMGYSQPGLVSGCGEQSLAMGFCAVPSCHQGYWELWGGRGKVCACTVAMPLSWISLPHP